MSNKDKSIFTKSFRIPDGYSGFEEHNLKVMFRHMYITKFLIFFAFVSFVAAIYMRSPDGQANAPWLLIFIILLVTTAIHSIYAFATKKTYWTLRLKEKDEAKRAAEQSKNELLQYAEHMKDKNER